MPTFETPQPITPDIETGVAYLTVVADDRPDTVVVVRPTNPDDESDTDVAERTTVELDGTTLTIRAPKTSRGTGPRRPARSTSPSSYRPARTSSVGVGWAT